MTKLLLIDNTGKREVEIGQELTIGRAYSNLLRLDAEEISRVHAIIYRRGHEFILRDLDSKNGVLVNGQKVVNTLLNPGDEIVIGEFRLMFDPPKSQTAQQVSPREAAAKAPADEKPARAAAVAVQTVPDDDDKEYQTFIVSLADAPDAVPMLPKVFYTIEEVEELSANPEPGAAAELLAQVLRLHRQLAEHPRENGVEKTDSMIQQFLDATVKAVGADRGVVVFKEGGTGDNLRLGAIHPPNLDVAVNRVVLRSVLREKNAVLCNRVQHDERFLKTSTVKKEKIGSLLAFPLMKGKRAAGLIYADAIGREDAFRPEHLLVLYFVARLLTLIAAGAAGSSESQS